MGKRKWRWQMTDEGYTALVQTVKDRVSPHLKANCNSLVMLPWRGRCEGIVNDDPEQFEKQNLALVLQVPSDNMMGSRWILLKREWFRLV